ncbi:exosome complex component RRP43-like [Bombus vosnesenskii]|uniref:Ribosomal RNA-processing protein 43 n=3 Tax=Pyrobombus TaxID=144703 RepID=A0A6J3L3J7_9HYME|nr:exosome complex component RRP43 [Bombus impatiens]XP_033188626.1 exosome complex component RRP43-like [Bombus vancouverensis nearcticus]XP_033306939.1 exosome complex component RRP43-like [Bombus bifarius]XP_033359827.1 exosome complex component RRP43-like [Bombus vosnesenskii]XP_050481504.1 exosome complex component RRP43-like [Bombus huntii]
MDSQYKIIHPVKYLQDHLAQDIRPDGRQFLSFRPISVNISSITHADSSAIFKIGNTTVVCGIKAELAAPKAESPECGYIVPNIELPPLCSPKFRPGPPSDQAQVITKLVENILRNSAAIDLKDLCVYKGKLVWVLYCDLVCINYDGSIIDACIGALTATLSTLTLPETLYNVETGRVSVNSTKRIRFLVKALPVSITFAIFNDQLLVADPTDDEESLCLGRLTIVMNEEKICCIHKPGGIPISQDLFSKSLSKCKKRAELIRSLIDAAISTIKQETFK